MYSNLKVFESCHYQARISWAGWSHGKDMPYLVVRWNCLHYMKKSGESTNYAYFRVFILVHSKSAGKRTENSLQQRGEVFGARYWTKSTYTCYLLVVFDGRYLKGVSRSRLCRISSRWICCARIECLPTHWHRLQLVFITACSWAKSAVNVCSHLASLYL